MSDITISQPQPVWVLFNRSGQNLVKVNLVPSMDIDTIRDVLPKQLLHRRINVYANAKENEDLILYFIPVADLRGIKAPYPVPEGLEPLDSVDILDDIIKDHDGKYFILIDVPSAQAESPTAPIAHTKQLITNAFPDGLPYIAPKPLLGTSGLHWDYQKHEDLSLPFEELRDNHPTVRFWSNLLDAKYDKKTRTLTLADNTWWLGWNEEKGCSLYVREHYERMWSKICWGMGFSDPDVKGLYTPDEADTRDIDSVKKDGAQGLLGYIVNGTPGIGKSHFGFYILWRLRCTADKPVVWYAGNDWFVFRPDRTVIVCGTRPVEYLSNELHWFIVDAQVPPHLEARTILLTSPRLERFKAFRNLRRVRMVYMPLWDGEEIIALRDMAFQQVKDHDLSDLCGFWGCVPRQVLTKAHDRNYQNERATLIASLGTQHVKDVFQKYADNAYPYGLVSGKVIHIDADQTYDGYTLQFASESIAAQLLGREGDERWLDAMQFLQATAANTTYAAARGALFEQYAHIRLRKGGAFAARKIGKDSKEEKVDIRPSVNVRHFYKPSELTRGLKDYSRPYSKTYEGIDAVLLPDSLFQITVGQRHGVEVEKLSGLFQAITEPLRLYFVVPEDIFKGHYQTPQPLMKSGKAAKLPKTDWRGRIEQWVLCMDFPGAK